MSAGYDSNLDDLFRALGWRKLCHQRLDKKSIMMYKTLNGMTPEYLRSSFVFRDNLNSYHLRNTENTLTLPKPPTDYLREKFLIHWSSVVERFANRITASSFLE